jgi:type I restriction-modification system DNA methylase subunit
MALTKSELYSSIWSACDQLRGGMDASQYKDYVLVLLFIKYISDKYAGVPYAPIAIPAGASFKDMVALKGKSDIGDQINTKIIAPLANANKLTDFPDFNDAAKLGTGKEMVERLTELIAIFENPALDFSKNRADGDDILGDAYEYLMRHFATESGKSKGQFYTPAEVSRVIAQILGIRDAKTSPDTTVYDPACGSGSSSRSARSSKARCRNCSPGRSACRVSVERSHGRKRSRDPSRPTGASSASVPDCFALQPTDSMRRRLTSIRAYRRTFVSPTSPTTVG